ncbi:unnamed protein product [Schistosoma mattheei]|uniref:Uncharacterized protein n=1 Tax=Schistosoma mattheei TaxID=31246 RepID=A0A183NTV0_9TREM|nr:unnamed protein product [Schistosoma mattheei]
MSYTDHLSASSNQSQCRQIMHNVEFSGTTFVEYVQVTEIDVSRCWHQLHYRVCSRTHDV